MLSGDNILHLTTRGYYEYHPKITRRKVSTRQIRMEKQSLITAVRERNTKTAVGMLRMRPDINLQDHKGNTALHYAILNHDSNAVGRLCEAGADTSLRNKKGKSCLHTAAALANVAMLRHIFRKQPESIKKINIQDHSNATPLLDATKKGNAKIIQDLLAKQACTLLADDNGNTPLHWAVITNNAQTTRLLVKISGRHDPVNQNMETPLILAAKKGFGTIFGILIQYSVDWILGGGLENTLLHAACQSPSPILEFFLRSHIIRYLERNDDDGLTPFHYALPPPGRYCLVQSVKRDVVDRLCLPMMNLKFCLLQAKGLLTRTLMSATLDCLDLWLEFVVSGWSEGVCSVLVDNWVVFEPTVFGAS